MGLLSRLISRGGCVFWDFLATLFVVAALIPGLVFQLKLLLGSGSFLSSLWLLGLCSRMCLNFKLSLSLSFSLYDLFNLICVMCVCVCVKVGEFLLQGLDYSVWIFAQY